MEERIFKLIDILIWPVTIFIIALVIRKWMNEVEEKDNKSFDRYGLPNVGEPPKMPKVKQLKKTTRYSGGYQPEYTDEKPIPPKSGTGESE
jgi:hypothetical protein